MFGAGGSSPRAAAPDSALTSSGAIASRHYSTSHPMVSGFTVSPSPFVSSVSTPSSTLHAALSSSPEPSFSFGAVSLPVTPERPSSSTSIHFSPSPDEGLGAASSASSPSSGGIGGMLARSPAVSMSVSNSSMSVNNHLLLHPYASPDRRRKKRTTSFASSSVSGSPSGAAPYLSSSSSSYSPSSRMSDDDVNGPVDAKDYLARRGRRNGLANVMDQRCSSREPAYLGATRNRAGSCNDVSHLIPFDESMVRFANTSSASAVAAAAAAVSGQLSRSVDASRSGVDYMEMFAQAKEREDARQLAGFSGHDMRLEEEDDEDDREFTERLRSFRVSDS